MHDHDDHSQADPGEQSSALENTADSTPADELIQGYRSQRTVRAGTVFGAIVGVLMGSVVGAGFCWVTGQFESLWQAVLAGALAGPFVGGFIGFRERKARGDSAKPDIAIFIFIVGGLLLGLLVGFLGIFAVRGKFSASLLLGAICGGPMIGLVIGGILDRAFEEWLKKSWVAASKFAVAGVGACIGIIYLVDFMGYGPDPDEVSRDAARVIRSEWSNDPNYQDAKVHQVTLSQTGRRKYAGFVEASIAGKPERLEIDVIVDDTSISVQFRPANE